MSKSLQVLFKEYPSLQKNHLWLTYKKERKREREKKREKEQKKIKENKKKVSKERE